MRTSLPVAAGLGLLLAVAAASAGAEKAVQYDHFWWQWRGPLATGVAPQSDPPVVWAEDQNVAWKVEIPGSGYATPIVWQDRIFLLTAVPQGSTGGDGDGAGRPAQGRQGRGRRSGLGEMEFTVMAIDRADGSLIWQRVARRQVPHEDKQPNNSWASSSAITDGERVYAFFGSRGLYAYTIDGAELWTVDFGDMRIRNGFGEGTTPVLHGEKLVVVWDHEGDSFIAALDKRSGEELWRQRRSEPESWATPLVVDVGGRTQVVTGAENRTRGYDLDSGELIWEAPGLTSNPIPSPVTANGIVYLTSGYRGNALRAIRLAEARGNIDSGSDAILWEYNRDTPYVPSPLLYDGNLYVLKSNNPILTVFDAERGIPHYGPQRLPGLQEIYASPVGAGGRVYLLGRDGGALVLDNGPAYRVLATNTLDDGFEASPAVVGDEMYLRGRRYLYKIAPSGRPD